MRSRVTSSRTKFKKRAMRNWVAVEPEGVEDDDQLGDWIERAIKFVKTPPRK
jgi:hypothetical protein